MNKSDISLAQFLSDVREKTGLSQIGLAKRANLEMSVIEDLESGRELFMAVTVRQKIAKALRLELFEIKQYEKLEDISLVSDARYIEEIREKILNQTAEELICAVCGSVLITKIEQMYDLEENIVLHPKARCTKCPFQIR